MTPTTRALVFDFDGTIIDSETPVYESWAETFRFAGAEPIPLERWLQDIGKADGHGIDVRSELCNQIGVDAISAQVETFRKDLCGEMLHSLPLRDGVEHWILAASAAGIPMGVASSSPTSWVSGHIERLGLADRFTTLSCADPGIPGKPDPTVYLTACESLGVAPNEALAIEDSTHGVAAAIAAGMRCIAAPGPITKTMEFGHASVRVDSLSELNPADWL
ncbi:MAG: HAD-IA family hydrolase [Acidimicrobiaceae bacterium]|jgi:HAD superfamily hydrolase (TIGR01509 family)|nr:HAD-IA family hydrolase [Acidimicrobiaceae bacterium]